MTTSGVVVFLSVSFLSFFLFFLFQRSRTSVETSLLLSVSPTECFPSCFREHSLGLVPMLSRSPSFSLPPPPLPLTTTPFSPPLFLSSSVAFSLCLRLFDSRGPTTPTTQSRSSLSSKLSTRLLRRRSIPSPSMNKAVVLFVAVVEAVVEVVVAVVVVVVVAAYSDTTVSFP